MNVHLDTLFRLITTYSPGENIVKDVVYFIAVSEKCEPAPQREEVNEAGWFSYGEALEKITYENDKLILKAADEYINK